MTPFEEQIVRALGSIADVFRQQETQRVRDKAELHQKLDSAIAYRDEAMAEDLAATNARVTELEKQLRNNGHAQ